MSSYNISAVLASLAAAAVTFPSEGAVFSFIDGHIGGTDIPSVSSPTTSPITLHSGSVNVAVQTDIGINRIYLANAPAAKTFNGNLVSATSFWSDNLTITGAGNIPVDVTVRVSFDGVVQQGNDLDGPGSGNIFLAAGFGTINGVSHPTEQSPILVDTSRQDFYLLGEDSQVPGGIRALDQFCPEEDDCGIGQLSKDMQISFSVNPGETFWLAGYMFLNDVPSGRLADFYHTAKLTGIDIPAGFGLQSESGKITRLEDGSFGIAAVPEPASWAMMIVGFGMVGAGVRGRRYTARAE